MKHERGNILFLILLAVVLFAALSYAVTRGERGQVKDASPEAAKSSASALLQYGALVENTVNRMVLVGGLRPETLEFRATGISDSSVSANAACTSNACRVFNLAGGGITAHGHPSIHGGLYKSAADHQRRCYNVQRRPG